MTQTNTTPTPLSDKEYIEELEKVVMFMCGVYSSYQESIAVQESNNQTDDKWFSVYMSLPTIQGTSNRIYVDRIGKLRNHRLNKEAPKMSLEYLYERLKSNNRRDKS